MSKIGRHCGGIRTIACVRDRCKVDEDSGCWEWAGALATNSGRDKAGILPVAWFGGRNQSVLRTALQLVGREPKAIVWRKCCGKLCVNPAHLITGSRKQWGNWVELRGHMRGSAKRKASNRRAKMSSGLAKLTPELARWAIESRQSGVEAAHALMVSPTTISRARIGRTWAPLSSPFAGLSAQRRAAA